MSGGHDHQGVLTPRDVFDHGPLSRPECRGSKVLMQESIEGHPCRCSPLRPLALSKWRTDSVRGIDGVKRVTGISESDMVRVESGDDLKLGDISIEFLHTPGHTPGNAMYLVGSTLLMGDTAIVTEDGSLEPVPEKRSDDPEQAARLLDSAWWQVDPKCLRGLDMTDINAFCDGLAALRARAPRVVRVSLRSLAPGVRARLRVRAALPKEAL